MGLSGCGKSTLLNIIGLLDQPTDGQYLFNGTEVSKFREKQRTGLRKGNIGFVFQSFNLIDEPTGNLDSQNGEEVMKLLEELHTEGTSIIMVTHSPAHAERAQRIVHLFDGHIVTENIRG
jgi:ABC-type lipoprotein export system ATPase subunit